MTDPLNISLTLKHRLFLLSIKELNEYFYSKKCSRGLPLCGIADHSQPVRPDLRETSLPGLL